MAETKQVSSGDAMEDFHPRACAEGGGVMPDLSPEEREALLRARDEIESALWDDTAARDDAAFIVQSVERFLAAVPRLREIPGMGFYGERWHVLYPNATIGEWMDKFSTAEVAADLNHTVGRGHHAVRLAVVEVATPTEEKGND